MDRGDRFIGSSTYRALDRAVSSSLLGAAWLVLSIPLITALAATVALYRCFDRERELGRRVGLVDYVREFVSVFRRSTKAALLLTLMIAVLAVLLGILHAAGVNQLILSGAGVVWILSVAGVIFHAAPLLGHDFDSTTRALLTFSFMHMLGYPRLTVKMIASYLAGVLILLMLPRSVSLIGASIVVCEALRQNHRLWHRSVKRELFASSQDHSWIGVAAVHHG